MIHRLNAAAAADSDSYRGSRDRVRDDRNRDRYTGRDCDSRPDPDSPGRDNRGHNSDRCLNIRSHCRHTRCRSRTDCFGKRFRCIRPTIRPTLRREARISF